MEDANQLAGMLAKELHNWLAQEHGTRSASLEDLETVNCSLLKKLKQNQ